MPTAQPFGRNSISESSLPPNLRKKRKSGNTIINSTTITNVKKTIKCSEEISAFKPISLNGENANKANKTDKPATAISLESGIIGADIEIATNGDVVDLGSSAFTANELIWLGNSNDLTQEPDFETGDYQQVLGIAISSSQMLVNIENIIYVE